MELTADDQPVLPALNGHTNAAPTTSFDLLGSNLSMLGLNEPGTV